jgi:3alpha(or 20beta)-hydroxysteroid dehydrogenase
MAAVRVALVTGGAQGIGEAIAERLARDGFDICVFDLPSASLASVRQHVEAHGRTFVSIGGSVDDNSVWQRAIASIKDQFGRLDVLVNNAGVSGYLGALTDYPEDEFDRVMAINAKGVFLGLKHCLPMLRETKGNVVNISSVSGLGGGAGIFGYTASKHAVVGMTLTAANEYASSGVRVNAVCPAPIDTDMMDSLARARMPDDPDAFARDFKKYLPMGRYGEPEEVANVVAFLAGPEASFVTGAIIPVDGGSMTK